MNLLSINNLAKIGREKPLFTGVTFGIQEGEKAALIGRNGTGKSTLLNTIAGVYSLMKEVSLSTKKRVFLFYHKTLPTILKTQFVPTYSKTILQNYR